MIADIFIMKRKEMSDERKDLEEIEEKSEKVENKLHTDCPPLKPASIFLPIITGLKIRDCNSFLQVSFGVSPPPHGDDSDSKCQSKCRQLTESYVLGNDASKISWMERDDLVSNPLDRKKLIRHFVLMTGARKISLPMTNLLNLSAGRLQWIPREKIGTTFNYYSRAYIFGDRLGREKSKRYLAEYLQSPNVEFLDCFDATKREENDQEDDGDNSHVDNSHVDNDKLISKYSLQKEFTDTSTLYDTLVPRGNKIRSTDWFVNNVVDEVGQVILSKTFSFSSHANNMLAVLIDEYDFPNEPLNFLVDDKVDDALSSLFKAAALGMKELKNRE
jgi:hypothetical protein